jgi:hypothetical protein
MGEIFFVLKTLIVTVAIVSLMQIRIGRATLEQHSLAWLHTSATVEALRGVADGAVAAAFNGIEWAKASYHKQFFSASAPKFELSSKKFWEAEASRAKGDEVD